MFRRHTLYIMSVLGCLCMMLAGCDHLSEDERLIYEKPEPAKRVVLLEDFTGQMCTNCPKATDVIGLLKQTYGDDLVAVSIHGGPLGFAGNARFIGLATETGDEYYNHWELAYQPIGLVNRHGESNYPEWAAAVKEEMSKTAPLLLNGEASVEDDAIVVNISAEGTDGNVEGKLQVWLLEDGIKAIQKMPDGTVNQDYIHNHVLRTAVNGTWGEAFSIKEGEERQHKMTVALEPGWNRENLSIVAFVYNDQGVQQAAKFDVKL